MAWLAEQKIKIRNEDGELIICTMGEFLEVARRLDEINKTKDEQLFVMCALGLLK